MRNKDEVLADFRQIVQELYAGIRSHDVINRLEQLTDEVSLLELEPASSVDSSEDPCRGIRQTIMHLKMSNPSPEQLVELSWELNQSIGQLSQMTLAAPLNEVDGTSEVSRAGTIHDDSNMQN